MEVFKSIIDLSRRAASTVSFDSTNTDIMTGSHKLSGFNPRVIGSGTRTGFRKIKISLELLYTGGSQVYILMSEAAHEKRTKTQQ